jgi:hypothetical protein
VGAATEGVIAGSAVEQIFSSTTPDSVIPRIPKERVVGVIGDLGVAGHKSIFIKIIIAVVATNEIPAASTGEGIVSFPAHDGVIPILPLKLVVAREAEQSVVTDAAQDLIAGAAPIKKVVSWPAGAACTVWSSPGWIGAGKTARIPEGGGSFLGIGIDGVIAIARIDAIKFEIIALGAVNITNDRVVC